MHERVLCDDLGFMLKVRRIVSQARKHMKLTLTGDTVFEAQFGNKEPSDGMMMDANGTRPQVQLKNGKLHEVAPKRTKREGTLITRVLRDLRREVTIHPIAAVAVVLGFLYIVLPTGGIMSSLGSVRYLFDKHGEAATQRAAEEIAAQPARLI